jgi:hypothetical protein
MEDSYNSPYNYRPSSPYYTLADYYNQTPPDDYISPNSHAALLGLTSAYMAPNLQEQQELTQDEFTQPQTQPTTTTQAKSPQ